MPTYRGTLGSHGHGAGSVYIAVGNDEVDAIRKTIARQWPDTTVLSVTQPYSKGYHIEHTGREYPIAWQMGRVSETERCTSDDVYDLVEIAEL